MPLFKRGTCKASVIVSTSVLACPQCGHTEMSSDLGAILKCSKCGCKMRMVSASASSMNEPHRTN